MSKFLPLTHYNEPLAGGYRLLPFNFTPLDAADYVATTSVGEFVVLDRATLERFARHQLLPNDPFYNLLKAKHFFLDDDSSVALDLLTDEMLEFCKQHQVLISTSLDGAAELHNKNRPRPGRDSNARAIAGIQLAREKLGHDRVSAVMTTTSASLSLGREIIDEYVRQGFDGIFLRPLSPYGFAVKTKSYNAYDRHEWLRFFVDGLDYILELNRRGTRFIEQYSATILTKMLTPRNPGYVDLQSPAGIGIGVLVYNYDGDVYASDEGRMLAEMGHKNFRLGNVHTNTYEDILLSDQLLEPLEQSFTGSVPMCSECAFEPFCGAEPVYHYATQRDYVGRKAESDFCQRNMGIFRHLIGLMRADDEIEHIFRSWVFR